MRRINWRQKLSGEHIGRLVVVNVAPDAGALDYAMCRCDCGSQKKIRIHRLHKRRVRSCGCWAREVAAAVCRRRTYRHGQKPAELYRKWKLMRRRCTPGYSTSKNYGDRGIKVCKQWSSSYTAFMDWAIANGWKPGLQIDRRRVNGPYAPANCRFVTHQVNQQNKRRAR